MFPVYAQDSSNPLPLSTSLFGTNPAGQYANQPLGAFISAVLPNVFTVIGIVLFVYLMFGGFLVITAAGNQQNLEQGQGVITNAIIGLVIVFAAYWLIQFIEILTGVNIL